MANIPFANRAAAFEDLNRSKAQWELAFKIGDYVTGNKLRNRIFVIEQQLNITPMTVLTKMVAQTQNSEQIALIHLVAEEQKKQLQLMGDLNLVPVSALPKDVQNNIAYNARFNGHPPPIEEVPPWEKESYKLPEIVTNAYALLNRGLVNLEKYGGLGGNFIDTTGKVVDTTGKIAEKVGKFVDEIPPELPSFSVTGPILLIGALAIGGGIAYKHL